MPILHDLRNITNHVNSTERALEDLKSQRNEVIATARKQGKTWPAIAEHSDLTVQGARNAADKYHGGA